MMKPEHKKFNRNFVKVTQNLEIQQVIRSNLQTEVAVTGQRLEGGCALRGEALRHRIRGQQSQRFTRQPDLVEHVETHEHAVGDGCAMPISQWSWRQRS